MLKSPFRTSLLLAALLPAAPLAPAGEVVPVNQQWASSGTTYANTDSLAACKLRSGAVRVFATSKDGHRIDVFDALDGRFLASQGRLGTEPGQFNYPNGIVAVEFTPPGGARTPLILVVERDNRRVQALHADDLRPAGTFGSEVLKRPYGGAVSYRPDGVYLYVTDTTVPRPETVRVFRLALEAGERVQGDFVRSFGEAAGPGAVLEAESIVVDDPAGRVLICDEHPEQHNVKVYTLPGSFTGRVFGQEQVRREPEGLALLDTPDGGLVLLTDQQKDLTVWHLFDRRTYEHRAAFTGVPRIANTDGICVYPEALRQMPRGALFAVHDDTELRAYSLEAILKLAAP